MKPVVFPYRKNSSSQSGRGIAPTIPQIVGKLNKNHESLLAGLNNFENIRNNPDSTVTAVIYRASGVK